MKNLKFKAHVEGNKIIIIDEPIPVDSGRYGQITIHEIFPFSGGFQFSRPEIEDEMFIEPFPSAQEGFPTIDLGNLKKMLADPKEQQAGMDLVICALIERLF